MAGERRGRGVCVDRVDAEMGVAAHGDVAWKASVDCLPSGRGLLAVQAKSKCISDPSGASVWTAAKSTASLETKTCSSSAGQSHGRP